MGVDDLYNMIESFPNEVPDDYVFVMNKTDYKNIYGKEWVEGVEENGIKIIAVYPPLIQDNHCYLMRNPFWDK